ncbi:MAG UNVERIFIED_CONTAM: hypothetical protein LVT10_13200 [Anaerolineae bacterium]
MPRLPTVSSRFNPIGSCFRARTIGTRESASGYPGTDVISRESDNADMHKRMLPQQILDTTVRAKVAV